MLILLSYSALSQWRQDAELGRPLLCLWLFSCPRHFAQDLRFPLNKTKLLAQYTAVSQSGEKSQAKKHSQWQWHLMITLAALTFPLENLLDFMSTAGSQKQRGSQKCLMMMMKAGCNDSNGRVDILGVSSYFFPWNCN